MSDYLRGVVTRVLAPGSVLRPRAPMPFESLRTASEEIVISAPEPRIATERNPQKPAALERSPASPGRTFASLPKAPRRSANYEPIAADESITTSPVLENALNERVPAIRIEPTFQTPAAHRIETVKTTASEEAVRRSIATPEVSPHAGIVRQTNVQAAAAAHALPVHRIPVTRLPRERAREESRAVVAAAPIEITIGRIDVRAVMPSAPPPAKPRAKAAAMSLDDYLASRGGRE